MDLTSIIVCFTYLHLKNVCKDKIRWQAHPGLCYSSDHNFYLQYRELNHFSSRICMQNTSPTVFIFPKIRLIIVKEIVTCLGYSVNGFCKVLISQRPGIVQSEMVLPNCTNETQSQLSYTVQYEHRTAKTVNPALSLTNELCGLLQNPTSI